MKITYVIFFIAFFGTHNLFAQIEYDTIYQINMVGDSVPNISEKPLVTYEDTLEKRVNYFLTIVNDSTQSTSSRFFYANKLLHYPNNFYKQKQKEGIRMAISDSILVNTALILLAGKVNANDDTTYQALLKYITFDSLGKFNKKLYLFSKEWLAHLALAKMGFQKHLDFVVDIIKKENDGRFFTNLFYIGNQEAIDLLSDFVFSEKTVTYLYEGPGDYWPKEYTDPIAFEAYYHLSRLVDNFPVEICKPVGSSLKCLRDLKSLKIVRKWVKKNRNNYKKNKKYDEYFIYRYLVLKEEYEGKNGYVNQKYVINQE
jgi:hypothetical protein